MTDSPKVPDLFADQASKNAQEELLAQEIMEQISGSMEKLLGSLSAQHLLIQTLETRMSHLEKLVTMMALKDSTIGPQILKMAKALNMDTGPLASPDEALSEQPKQ